GQLKFGVRHLDDVPVLEEQLGKKLTVIQSFKDVNQLSHYLVMVALRDKLKEKRDSYVRLVAALIDATRFTLDARNLDRVAQIAAVTGRTPKTAKETLPLFARIELWPVGNDGLAKEEGFFKDQGLDVEVRPFDSGASAAQAVVAGNVDLSLSPTAAIVRMISNAGVDLVGIYGQEHPDWLLASAEAKSSKCADLKDQAVGVDSVGGARAAALGQFLRPCGLKVDQVKLVSLSSNVTAAMIAGHIKFRILDTDDVPVLEDQMKRKLNVVSSIRDVDPHSHYNLLVTTRKNLQTRRDAYVRAVAGLMQAAS